jgi:hypothetical protein
VVGDVAKYQEFLPWCTHSRVLFKSGSRMDAELGSFSCTCGGWTLYYLTCLSHVLRRNRLQDAARPELRLTDHTQQATSHQGIWVHPTQPTAPSLIPFHGQVVVPDEGSLFTHLINNWAFHDLSTDGNRSCLLLSLSSEQTIPTQERSAAAPTLILASSSGHSCTRVWLMPTSTKLRRI